MPNDALGRAAEGRHGQRLEPQWGITRRLVPDKRDLPVQPVRGAVQRLFTNGCDEIRDRHIVDRLRVDSTGARIAREAREA